MGNCLTCLKSGDNNAASMMDHQVAPIGAHQMPSTAVGATRSMHQTHGITVTVANERGVGGGKRFSV